MAVIADRLRRAGAAVLGGLAGLLLVGVIAGYAGPLVFALDTLAHLRLHFGVLALGVAVLAAAERHLQAVGAAGAAAILAFAGVGVIWQDPPVPGSGRQITVMTANLCNLNGDVAAMRAAVDVEVTVKCRIGVDDQEPEDT